VHTEPTAIDLFCGCGGLTLGFRKASFKVLLGLDMDKDAMLTYTYKGNNPNVAWLLKDAREVTGEEIMSAAGVRAGDVDVLMAGVPCEGYSLLNRRYDPKDPTNFLFQEFVRIAKELRPRCVLIENVPGLARRANGTFAGAIIQDLSEKLGYATKMFECDAVEFGVPQHRERIFFLGISGAEPSFPGGKTEPHVSVGDAIGDLPELKAGEAREIYDKDPMTEYQKKMRTKEGKLLNHKAPKHPAWTIKLLSKVKPGAPIYKTFKQRIRLPWNEPAPTIPAGGIRPQWFYAHPTQPRGLTVRECARLQSFPDDYVFFGPLIKQRIQVGDAVPPLLAQAIAEHIKGLLREAT
jgi:DNA (cytosine-5)-methyltransferase 1